MRRRASRGSTILETAMYLPMLFILLVGMVEIARVTYTYHTLQKMLYTVARYVGTQQAVNFCDTTDASLAAAKNLALTGSTDGTADPLVPNLTIDQIDVRLER
ncbi:MAG: pilus assembly protein, partial [Acidobacteria bacterium]|nr:pilus assembly protein [Acidobacteriota bacterium]